MGPSSTGDSIDHEDYLFVGCSLLGAQLGGHSHRLLHTPWLCCEQGLRQGHLVRPEPVQDLHGARPQHQPEGHARPCRF